MLEIWFFKFICISFLKYWYLFCINFDLPFIDGRLSLKFIPVKFETFSYDEKISFFRFINNMNRDLFIFQIQIPFLFIFEIISDYCPYIPEGYHKKSIVKEG